jgi:hypothetical protein
MARAMKGRSSGGQHKGQRPRAGRRPGIQHEEINVVVLAPGLRDVFAGLPDEKFVQLEVFADDGFADGAHRWGWVAR